MVVYFAMILIVLLGFCGLAVDVGKMELRTLQLQAAADNAALSAAAEYQRGNSTWQSAATTEVAASEAVNNIPSAPPGTPQFGASYGAYVPDQSAIQVAINQRVSTLFLGLLGSGTSSLTLSVRAVAMVPPCLYFLGNPGVVNLFSITGDGLQLASGGVDTANCPIYSNYGVGVALGAHIVGSQTKSAHSAASSQVLGTLTPSPMYSTPALSDPLAYVVAPTLGACNHLISLYILPSTLQPGVYCGSLTVLNTTATLAPGLYVITGGASFSGSIINGTGVTLYFTKGGIYSYGTFSVNGSMMNLSAPTDASAGGIPGILVFGDRNWIGGDEDFIFTSSTIKGDGIIYTTGTGIYDYNTNLSGNNYFNIVTANLYDVGSEITPSSNYSALPGGNPLHTSIALVQ